MLKADSFLALIMVINSRKSGQQLHRKCLYRLPTLTSARCGYFVPWGDREILLRVLYENLQDRSKVFTNKKVVDIDHGSASIKVACEDGSVYDGHVVAGADGVFSKIREKMWHLAEAQQPDLVRRDRNGKPSTESNPRSKVPCLPLTQSLQPLPWTTTFFLEFQH